MGKTMSLKSTIEELKAAARELGGELLVDESDFHGKNHLNCLWYDSGQIGAFVYKGYTCSVEVAGDVDLKVLDRDCEESILEYRKPANSGAYGVPEAIEVLKNDKTLEKLDDAGRIVFGMQNWVGLRVFDEDDNSYDVDITLDDNVLEALGDFETFIETIEDILKEKEEEMGSVVADVLEDASYRAYSGAEKDGKEGEKVRF